MRKQIRKQAVRKIKSNSGASILIALLVFLIAAMTGSVILTSATVSNGAVHQRQKSEERMAVLQSSAKLLSDEFSGLYEKTWTYGDPDDPDKVTAESEASYSKTDFTDVMDELVTNVMNGNAAEKKLKLTVPVDSESKTQEVNADVRMSDDYRISIDVYEESKKDGYLQINYENDPLMEDYDENGNLTRITVQEGGSEIQVNQVENAGQTDGNQ